MKLNVSSFVFAAALAGCFAEPEPPEPAGPPGHLVMALVTTGSDGASYRLLDTAKLEVRNESFFEVFSLGDYAATVVINVPAGDYQVTLVPDFDYTEWPLIRDDGDGTTTDVTSKLLTPMPVSVTVEADQMTALVLAFQVAASGVVTFALGALDVSAEVQLVEASGHLLEYDCEAEIAAATVHEGAPEELDGYWPPAGTSGVQVQFSGSVDKWELSSGSTACAGVALDVPYFAGHPALVDLLNETLTVLQPHPATLCVVAEDGTQRLEIQTARFGPAQTPTLAGLGSGDFIFSSRFAAELAEPVFDGATLDLGLLDWTHGPTALSGELHVDAATDEGVVPWYHADFAGTVIVRLAPQSE
jgi:hypothetical protein